MNQEQSRAVQLGDVAAKLEGNADFNAFIQDVERRRNVIIQQALIGVSDDYEGYRELRGAFLAFSEVIGMTRDLQDQAREVKAEIGEQGNESE